MRKHVLPILLAAAVLLGLLPISATAADVLASGHCGYYGDNVLWQIDVDGNMQFTGSGKMSDFAKQFWNDYRDQIRTVEIEDGITTLPEDAFRGYPELQRVRFPSTLESIPERVCSECRKLTEIEIPEGAKTIEEAAFSGCTGLTEVTIPASIRAGHYIDMQHPDYGYTFSGCTGLEQVTVLGSYIEAYAFYRCSNLKTVILSSNLRGIGASAFSGIENLDNLCIYYEGTEEEWAPFLRNGGGIGLKNVQTVFNYPVSGTGSICFLNACSVSEKTASFDYDSCPRSLTDSALAYLDEHRNELLNHYVTIWTEGSFPAVTVTKIRPAEAHVGVVTDWKAEQSETGVRYLTALTIDGTTYPYRPETQIVLGDYPYENQEILFLMYGGTIQAAHPVTEQTATVERVGNGAVTIGGKEYRTVFLLDSSDQEKAVAGRPVHYCAVEDFRNYNALIRISENTTITGKCSTYDVFSHTIFLDGVGYPVKAGYEPDAAALLNARAFLVLEDGVVVYADALKNIPVTDIGSGTQTVRLSYGVNGFDKTSADLSFSVKNTADYDFPAGCDEAVVLSDEYFRQDFGKTVTKVTAQADDGLTLKLKQTPSGKVGFGESKTVGVTASVRKGYDPVANDNRLGGTVTCTMTDADGKTYTAAYRVIVDISVSTEVLRQQAAAQKQKEDKLAAERQKLASNAADALKKMFNGNTLSLNTNTMYELFGMDADRQNQFAQELLATLLVTQIPEKLEKESSLPDQINKQLIDKLMGEYKKFQDDVGASKYTIPLYYRIQTKDYGTVTVRFDCEMSGFSLNQKQYAATGTIYCQVVSTDPDAKRSISTRRQQIGTLTETDTQAFCDAAYELVMRDLKYNYNEAYGKRLDEVADLLLDEPVKAIMKEREITASGEFWEFMEWPTKTTVNKCPTDVYVYDASGALCGAIENGKVTMEDDGLVLRAEKDAKSVEQMSDGYTVVYSATGSGTMDVIVTEYGGRDKPVRTVTFSAVPLRGDEAYRQQILAGAGETREEYSLVLGAEATAPDRDEIVWQFSGNTPKVSFADVPAGAYYTDAVVWAVAHGVTNGTSETTFSPEASCTRAQMVTFLWRANGSPEPTGAKNPFRDIAKDAYCYKAVLWAVREGITNGTSDTTFSPNDPVTRAQTVTFLWRMENAPKIKTASPFRDVSAGQYYTQAVLWAVQAGVTNGTGSDTFSPGSPCTRAQIVTFLYRLMGEVRP